MIRSRSVRATMGAVASVLAFSGVSAATSSAAWADASTPVIHLVETSGAQKAAAPEDCPAGLLCVWWDINFTGTRADAGLDDTLPPGSTCGDIPENVATQITAVVNNTSRDLVFYHDAACRGNTFHLVRGGRIGYVGNSFNDHVFSFTF